LGHSSLQCAAESSLLHEVLLFTHEIYYIDIKEVTKTEVKEKGFAKEITKQKTRQRG